MQYITKEISSVHYYYMTPATVINVFIMMFLYSVFKMIMRLFKRAHDEAVVVIFRPSAFYPTMINGNKTDLYLRLLCRCRCSRIVLTVSARLILEVNIPHRVAHLRKRATKTGSRNSASIKYLPNVYRAKGGLSRRICPSANNYSPGRQNDAPTSEADFIKTHSLYERTLSLSG